MSKSNSKSELPAAKIEAKSVQDLQSEVLRLQAQLKGEKLRADAYEEMINVAEGKFNIAIRKKAGAKRS